VLPVPDRSFVVTGGARGVGRVIAERLTREGAVVVLDRDAAAMEELPASVVGLVGDAADPRDVRTAADLAEQHAPLAGWVNDAAVFRDVALHVDDVLPVVQRNLAPAVVGSAEAVRRFLAHGRGAIVNVSSHQAQRPVRGALAYAVAKAAIEGLTRATAVDYGPAGVRANAVALGSIETERSRQHVTGLGDEGPAYLAALAAVHPLGRIGAAAEVAEAVAFLLSDAASFISGAVLPVDGGRGALGADPEARDVV
jgi:NAD(P)-dependent dehydrogenase (short-subunit alcohol dehydrogenase family)